jgi:uncharacterized protein
MKLHLSNFGGQNAITGHGEGYVAVNREQVFQPLIVTPDALISPWRLADPAAPSLDDFDALFALAPTLVIFGSGRLFRFPDARIMAAFAQRRIGFEVMDTPAACRTYNVLMGEGREVAAALLV